MTLFTLIYILYGLTAVSRLVEAARECMLLRQRFLLADEVILALFWPFIWAADIVKAWKTTKRFPGKW